MLNFLPTWLVGEVTRVAIMVLGGAACFAIGVSFGINYEKSKIAADTAAAYQKRTKVDAKVDGRPAYQLCLDAGGVSAQCEQLRGLDSPAQGK
jgi:hypothetical protein